MQEVSMANRHSRRLIAVVAAASFVAASPLTASQDRPRQRAPRHQPQQQAVAPADSPDLRLQVGLDRAGFSPGEIDGHRGLNTTRALQAFAQAHKLTATDQDAIARALFDDNAPVLTTYTITSA